LTPITLPATKTFTFSTANAETVGYVRYPKWEMHFDADKMVSEIWAAVWWWGLFSVEIALFLLASYRHFMSTMAGTPEEEYVTVPDIFPDGY